MKVSASARPDRNPKSRVRCSASGLPSRLAVALRRHLPFLAPSLEDIDSINFALGLRDFDPRGISRILRAIRSTSRSADAACWPSSPGVGRSEPDRGRGADARRLVGARGRVRDRRGASRMFDEAAPQRRGAPVGSGAPRGVAAVLAVGTASDERPAGTCRGARRAGAASSGRTDRRGSCRARS